MVKLRDNILDDIEAYDIDLLLNNQIFVDLLLEEDQIVLKTVNLPEDLKEKLISKYGNKFEVKFVSDLPKPKTEALSRYGNWNYLGGGIAIETNGGRCTTAAMAKKDSRYFILTAGHCIYSGGTYSYQYTEKVGRPHTYNNADGYDVGLIQVTNDNTFSGGRLASNGFFKYSAQTFYDDKIVGVLDVANGQYICKSGTETGFTCATIQNKYSYYYDNKKGYRYNVVEVRNTASNNYSSGGDSGSITVLMAGDGKYYLVGVHSGGYDTSQYSYGYFTRVQHAINIWDISIHTSSTAARIVY